MNLFLNTKLKGGSLYIAILVSIIIGVLLSIFIWLSRYNQMQLNNFSQSSQLLLNISSGFEMAQSQSFNQNMNGLWIKNSFNNDSIKVEKKTWGAFELIKVSTKNQNYALHQSGIYGTYMSADTALLIGENSRPIGVCGNMELKANCYLPSPGIKPVYIEGASYNGQASNLTFIKKSPVQIPQISTQLIEAWQKEQSEVSPMQDSIVTNLARHSNQAFSKKTLVYMASNMQLTNWQLQNNIKIIAENIVVDSTCQLNNVLLVCNKVHFKTGFKGKVHVIAKDSIVCESNCVFNYPSSFVLLPTNKMSRAFNYIQLTGHCVFYGALLSINDNQNSEQQVMIRLNKEVEVNGLVYSNQLLHLEGVLNANVYAQKLLLKTPSAVYENHFMNCILNPKKHASIMSVPLLFKSNNKLICCEKIS